MRVLIGLSMAALIGFAGAVSLFDIRGWMSRERARREAWWTAGPIRRRLHPGMEKMRTGDRIIGVLLLVLGVLFAVGVLFGRSR